MFSFLYNVYVLTVHHYESLFFLALPNIGLNRFSVAISESRTMVDIRTISKV